MLHGPHRILSDRCRIHVYIHFDLSIGFYRLDLSRKILPSVIVIDRAVLIGKMCEQRSFFNLQQLQKIVFKGGVHDTLVN